MKMFNLVVVMVLLTLGSAQAAMVRNVDAPTAQKMLQQNKEVVLLDVRTPQEYFATRIPGARLIPIDRFLARIGEVPTDRPLIIYCAVGLRSSQVAEYLARKGYPEVYDLRGGIEAWAKLYRLPYLQGPP